ncbi:MAG: hypothetical protein LBQ10_05825 [Desulfovibrio sp.]|nr:hypothetical protein [Desulfovibrio sp.]
MPLTQILFISRPEILQTINDQLHGILQGQRLGMTTLLIVTGAMLVTRQEPCAAIRNGE